MPTEHHSAAGELETLRTRVVELETLNRSLSGELHRTRQQLNALSAQFAAARAELNRRDSDPDILDLGAPAQARPER